MKSKRSAKTPGGATPLSSNPAVLEPEISTACAYRSKTGHRCHMLAFDPDSPFCPHHARENLKRQRRELASRARLLLGTMRQFPTSEHVQFLLGNLVTQLAFGRVDRKDALALAYVSQLLLQTYPRSPAQSRGGATGCHHQVSVGCPESGLRPNWATTGPG